MSDRQVKHLSNSCSILTPYSKNARGQLTFILKNERILAETRRNHLGKPPLPAIFLLEEKHFSYSILDRAARSCGSDCGIISSKRPRLWEQQCANEKVKGADTLLCKLQTANYNICYNIEEFDNDLMRDLWKINLRKDTLEKDHVHKYKHTVLYTSIQWIRKWEHINYFKI